MKKIIQKFQHQEKSSKNEIKQQQILNENLRKENQKFKEIQQKN